MKKVVRDLKEFDEDYEFYPTTDEIIETIIQDLQNQPSINKAFWESRYNDDNKVVIRTSISESYSHTYEKYMIRIESFLDIGAGDGRVLNIDKTSSLSIGDKYAIEKSQIHADNLIKNGVGVLGRDFFKSTLIDKKFTVVFSNPPYSVFKMWVNKMMMEINAEIIYLLIPDRWVDDSDLVKLVKDKGYYVSLGHFDFENAERSARAKVELIKIYPSSKRDTFDNWIEENISTFDKRSEVSETIEEVDRNNVVHKMSDIDILLDSYEKDLSSLLELYKALGNVEFKLLEQLGLTKMDIMSRIKLDISGLKNKYWHKAFDYLEVINSKLTYKTRNKLLESIKWFTNLDFTSDNIYSIIVWVIEHFNNYTINQTLSLYDDLSNFKSVRAYKSNDKWVEGSFRFRNKPEKYSLDYRIVVSTGYQLTSYHYDKFDNSIDNLAVVASTLGFENKGIHDYSLGKHYCYTKDDKVLFEYRIYKNNNIHFKIDQELMMKFNVTVGKLKNWLESPKSVADEFDISLDKAEKYFNESEILKLGKSNYKLLEFK